MSIKPLPRDQVKGLLDTVGIPLDPWQIDQIMKLQKDGTRYLSSPRQVGKTQLALGVIILLALQGYSCLFLTHRADVARDAYNRISLFAPQLRKAGLIVSMLGSNGFYEVQWKGGAKSFFRTRGSSSVGVGMTFDAVVYDESAKMSPTMLEDVEPILSISPLKWQLFLGTPSTDEDLRLYPDAPLLAAKKRQDPQFSEFSAAAEYDPAIPITAASLRKANPSYSRVPGLLKMVKDSQAKMSHRAVCRQYLGVWHIPSTLDNIEPELDKAEIEKALSSRGTSSSSGFYCGVGLTPDSPNAHISFNDGTMTEVVTTIPLNGGDLDAVVDFLFSRIRSIRVVLIPGNARGKALYSLLEEKRVQNKVRTTSVPEMSNSITRLLSQIRGGSLRVYDAAEARMALSSFGTGIDSRSGGLTLVTAIPSDEALIMSLALSTAKGTAAQRTEQPKSQLW